MKALTLTQPWATLVAFGAKTIETRSWSTSYRGRIAIHAAAGLGPVGGLEGLVSLCYERAFYDALQPACSDTFFEPKRLPRGKIVAVADLVDCRKTQLLEGVTVFEAGHEWRLTAQERAFGDYGPGRFAWLLANVRPLRSPLPYRGAQGLRPVTPEVTALIEAQL